MKYICIFKNGDTATRTSDREYGAAYREVSRNATSGDWVFGRVSFAKDLTLVPKTAPGPHPCPRHYSAAQKAKIRKLNDEWRSEREAYIDIAVSLTAN